MKATKSTHHISPADVRPSIGFLGVGRIGRNTMKSLIDSESASVKGIYDSSRDQAKEVARIASGAEIADSFEDLIAMDLDGLVISTSNALQARQVILALSAGLPVFSQTSLSVKETFSVINAARSADRLLGLDLPYRFMPGTQRIKSLIEESAIGDVTNVNLVFHNAYGPSKSWFNDRELSREGYLIDLGTHLVDCALWVLNYPEIRQISGRMISTENRREFSEKRNVEDFAHARLDLSSGAIISLSCSPGIFGACGATIEMVFCGTSGTLSFKNVAGSYFDFRLEHYIDTRRKTLDEGAENWGSRAAISWARQLAASNAFSPEIESIQLVAGILQNLYQNPDVAVVPLTNSYKGVSRMGLI